jgi:hypothetical protein
MLLPENPNDPQVYPYGEPPNEFYFFKIPLTFAIAGLWNENGAESVPIATSDYFGFYWTAQ